MVQNITTIPCPLISTIHWYTLVTRVVLTAISYHWPRGSSPIDRVVSFLHHSSALYIEFCLFYFETKIINDRREYSEHKLPLYGVLPCLGTPQNKSTNSKKLFLSSRILGQQLVVWCARRQQNCSVNWKFSEKLH